MKRLLFFTILLCACLPLFSQTRDAKIHVPFIEGAASQKDQSFFFRQLSYETANLHYTLEKDRISSDFFLKGSIMSAAEINLQRASKEKNILLALEIIQKYNNRQYGDEQVFFLDLVNSQTEEVAASQYLVYRSVDDPSVAEYVSEIVRNLLASLPKIDIDDTWRNKWLYLGLNALWTPRIYSDTNREMHWATFGLAFAVEYQFLNFMAVSLEPQFVRDWIVITVGGEQFTDLLLEVPLTIKYVVKPLNYLMLEPYAGVALNFSLMGATQPSIASWLAGFEIGIKAGPGMITIDPRFGMDFSKSTIKQSGIKYSRMMINLGIGYKIGLLPKSK